MARPRPGLPGWNESTLHGVESTDPGDWVLDVLTDGLSIGPGRTRSWSFGEIREAIRREVESRTHDEVRANKTASIRTWRGLSDLKERGLVSERGGRYRVPLNVRFTEMNVQLLRSAVEQGVRIRMEIGPRNNPYVAEYASGSRKALLTSRLALATTSNRFSRPHVGHSVVR